MSSCSKLYSILKSPDLLNLQSVNANSKENDEPLNEDLYRNDYSDEIWKCWECSKVFADEQVFVNHLKQCKSKSDVNERIIGCPFCPKELDVTIDSPFSTSAFNNHIREAHANVTSLVCSYCLKQIDSCNLEDLAAHVVLTHKIPWQPSPATLSHMRETQLPHRVVTCLGCGWCTFVLRANNAAQPPNSLEAHMSRCAFNGGQVRVTPISNSLCESVLDRFKAIKEAEQISFVFAKSFPSVRGYQNNTDYPTSPMRIHRYIRGIHNSPKQSTETTPVKVEPSVTPVTITDEKVNKESDTSVKSNTKEPIFDIPLTLPPPPASSKAGGKRSSSLARLFVCPLCGDNALASLRERDEHLQNSHHGELVFPCQICGMAYPFYIALRRHAALQHDSDFDTVRYGPPDLLDSEPIECPECFLVAFQDPLVLKMHINRSHKKITSPLNPSMSTNSLTKDNHSVLNIDFDNSPSSNQLDARSEICRLITALRGRSSTGRPRGRPRGSKAKPKMMLHSEFSLANNSSESQSFVMSNLEISLSKVDGSHAPTSCSYCNMDVDNAKELVLHTELEHSTSDTSDIEQLGCQACGRVFFGSGGRIDLIGHLRVLHPNNSDDANTALICPHSDQSVENTDPSAGSQRHCDARFASPRLRQIHLSTRATQHPDFACPLRLDCSSARQAILATEVAADKEGIMVVVYCCPNCSRLFAGQEADARFVAHSKVCALGESEMPMES